MPDEDRGQYRIPWAHGQAGRQSRQVGVQSCGRAGLLAASRSVSRMPDEDRGQQRIPLVPMSYMYALCMQ